MRRALVAILAAGAAGGALAAPASGGQVEVVVVPRLDLAEIAPRAAVGLLVPGAGETVSRAGARSALERGRTTSSLLGGVTRGDARVTLSARPGTRATVYVVLPPPGRNANTRRFPIAVAGAGYGGLLTSTSTRIPGLVSIADVAPTVLALREGGRPPIRWTADADAPSTVEELEERLDAVSRSRDAVTVALVATALVLALAGLLLRWGAAARATLAAPLCALAVSLVLSGLEAASPALAIALAFGLTVPLALAAVASARVGAWLLAAFVTAYLAVLAWAPDTAALAVIGPHPETGGRFFGVTNLVETLLLVGSVAVVATAPALPAGALALVTIVTVGWSRAGADGGGILVLGAAFLVVALLRRHGRIRAAHLALGAALVVGVALAVVLLDRLAGGSSHVTRAVGDGPGAVLDDVGRRLELSWHAATHNAHTIGICAAAIVAIGLVALRLPRTVAGTALLAGLVVSLAVNDSPPDVLVTGALGLAGLAAEARALAARR